MHIEHDLLFGGELFRHFGRRGIFSDEIQIEGPNASWIASKRGGGGAGTASRVPVSTDHVKYLVRAYLRYLGVSSYYVCVTVKCGPRVRGHLRELREFVVV